MDWDHWKDIYNWIEPFVWYLVAGVVWWRYGREVRPVWPVVVLVVGMVVFGTSDFFETEAWWTPWWLLVWKVASGAVIAAMVGWLWWQGRKQARSGASSGVV